MSYEFDLYEWTKEQATRSGGGRRTRLTGTIWRRKSNCWEQATSTRSSPDWRILIVHLLKWKYQPEWKCGSWRGSIFEARHRIARLIKKNPSLSAYPGEYLPEAYPVARRSALAETGLLRPPEGCPWTIDEIC